MALPGSATPPPLPPETPRTHPKGYLSLTPTWCLLPWGPTLSPMPVRLPGLPDCTRNFTHTHPRALSPSLLSLRHLRPAPPAPHLLPLKSSPGLCVPVLICPTHTRHILLMSANIVSHEKAPDSPASVQGSQNNAEEVPPPCPGPLRLVGVGSPPRPPTAPLGSLPPRPSRKPHTPAPLQPRGRTDTARKALKATHGDVRT